MIRCRAKRLLDCGLTLCSVSAPRLVGPGAVQFALFLAMLAPSWSAAATGSLAISAVVLSKSNCQFTVTGALSLTIPDIDPSQGSALPGSLTTTVICRGSANPATFSITADDGANSVAAGIRQVKHISAAAYMRYSLSVSPASATIAKNAPLDVTISASIAPVDFQNAIAGQYTDSVRLTISP